MHTVVERNSPGWNLQLLDTPVDRSDVTAREFLRENGFELERMGGKRGPDSFQGLSPCRLAI